MQERISISKCSFDITSFQVTLDLQNYMLHRKLGICNHVSQKTFENLKTGLSDAVCLSFPSKDCTLTITSDASNTAIGACFNQFADGKTEPLAFFSRKLSDRERRFSTFERELLAIFCAVKKWKNIIDGFRTTVFTDHKPIVGAFKNSQPRLSDKKQWQLSFITEYVCDIIYISGKDNVAADTLTHNINAIKLKLAK